MRVVVIGAGGGIGSGVVFALLLRGFPGEIVLMDAREHMAVSHFMDLEQTLELVGGGTIRVGGESDLRSADIVVVAAGAPFRPATTRNEYLADNLSILGAVAAAHRGAQPRFTLIVTNPVDVLCAWYQKQTGIPRAQIGGYTLNDSLRLRTGIRQALGLTSGEVEAWVLGEHGETAFPVWSRVEIDGRCVDLTPSQRQLAEAYFRDWYPRHVALNSGRTSTWTSALGVADMLLAFVSGQETIWPMSTPLDGEYSLHDVSLSVPVRFADSGLEILEWTLTPAEERSLHRSARQVRSIVRTIATPPPGRHHA